MQHAAITTRIPACNYCSVLHGHKTTALAGASLAKN